jgi:hypothetical protein
MEALKQAQIKDNYESFIELVADYEQDELDKRIDLLTRIEKEENSHKVKLDWISLTSN